MFIGGVLWVDGTTPQGEVIALIGGKECGRGKSFTLPDGGFPTLLIVVPSDAQQPGCGTTGSQVTLTINGRAMDDTIDWQPGFQQPRQFFSGPVVAQYTGQIRFDKAAFPSRVVPYLDGVACGGQVNPMQGDGEAGYEVVVLPAELRPGCGRDGVVVTFDSKVRPLTGDPSISRLTPFPGSRARRSSVRRSISPPSFPPRVCQLSRRANESFRTLAILRVDCGGVRDRRHPTSDGSGLMFEVKDNGVGFDAGGAFPGHIGLRSMRERSAKISGTIEIESAPGAGARIIARLPI